MYPSGYIKPTNTLLRTEQFVKWLKKLRDQKGKACILRRLDGLSLNRDIKHAQEMAYILRETHGG